MQIINKIFNAIMNLLKSKNYFQTENGLYLNTKKIEDAIKNIDGPPVVKTINADVIAIADGKISLGWANIAIIYGLEVSDYLYWHDGKVFKPVIPF